MKKVAIALVLATLAAATGWAEEAKPASEPAGQTSVVDKAKKDVKEGAAAVGHFTREVTRGIGHATRDTAKAIGHGTRAAASGTKKAVSDAWNGSTSKE